MLERAERCGGRLATCEFHPGFRASPFQDELAPIPAEIFWALDLARRGAVFVPTPSSLALWPDRRDVLPPRLQTEVAERRLLGDASARRASVLARAMADANTPPARSWFQRRSESAPWNGEDWAARSLAELLAETQLPADRCAHLMVSLLGGRSADPSLAGSVLQLLAPRNSGVVMGGLATLAGALEAAAREAGAEITCGLDVSDIRQEKRRVAGVCLADGTEIAARAVISTLDLKRTFLTLFAWNDLPLGAAKRASNFRQAAGTARLLLALEAPPPVDAALTRGAIHVSPDTEALAEAHAACRAGTIAERLPLTLRLVSASDPGLAPGGKAVMTVTAGCIPYHLFDGPWTHDKRKALSDRAMAQIEAIWPGVASRVVAAELIVPPDIEEALGLSEGDLDGGEMAPDQMLRFRPFAECSGGRTPVEGLYLAGPSSTAGPLATCASGIVAARAVLTDLGRSA